MSTQSKLEQILGAGQETFKTYSAGRVCGVAGAVVSAAINGFENGIHPSTFIGGVAGAVIGYQAGRIADGVSLLTQSHSPVSDMAAFTVGYGAAGLATKVARQVDKPAEEIKEIVIDTVTESQPAEA